MESALPNYEIGAELGRGAFGLVFEGRHTQLDRKVAIKQLPRAIAADPAARQRFLTESRTVAALQHPNIVPVYDFVERDGLHLLVMEYLGGGSLAARAEAGLDAGEACAVIVSVAGAVQHAHERGVLHRDIKPDNVLFTTDGVAKLADFGIAKLVEQPENLTMTGTVVGTPAYMAPEVALGEEAGPEADVYALGVVLYELLAGRPPFPPRPTAAAALLQRVNDDPAPLRDVAPELPPELATVAMRAIARERVDRIASAAELADALRPFVHAVGHRPIAAATDARVSQPTVAPRGLPTPAPPPARPRRRPLLIGAAVLVVVVAVAALALLASGGSDDPDPTALAGATGPTVATTEVTTTTEAPAGNPGGPGNQTSPGLAVLADATTRFRTSCEVNYSAEQCQCAIDRIQREIGLSAFVDIANDIATNGRTNRPNAVAIMAQCLSR